MESMETLYADSTGVQTADRDVILAKYAAQLNRINPSADELEQMRDRATRQLKYYQSPQATKDARKRAFAYIFSAATFFYVLFAVTLVPAICHCYDWNYDFPTTFFWYTVVTVGAWATFGTLVALAMALEDVYRFPDKISTILLELRAIAQYQAEHFSKEA